MLYLIVKIVQKAFKILFPELTHTINYKFAYIPTINNRGYKRAKDLEFTRNLGLETTHK